MTHKLNRFRMLALLVLPVGLILGACSDDDKVTDPTPAIGACCLPDGSCEIMTQAECGADEGVWQGGGTVCDPDPCHDDGFRPRIPMAEIVWDVDFGSTDPNAIQAWEEVGAQIGTAAAFTEIVGQVLTSLDGADWTYQGSGCYIWSDTEEGCTWGFRVCRSAAGLDWTLTLDGACDPGQPPYDNWVVVRGSSSVDGTSGEFRFHDYAAGFVMMTWVWEIAEDGRTGTWDFFVGTPDLDRPMARLSWEEGEEETQKIDWLLLGVMTVHWEMEVTTDGTGGWMKSFVFDDDSSAWMLDWETIWHSDGTGSRTEYDQDGNPVSTVTW